MSVTHSPDISHEVIMASAAQIVSAYIMNRPHEPVNITQLTADVYATLSALSRGEEVKMLGSTKKAMMPVSREKAPKVAVADSVKPDYLVCLEDGKRVKMLKRHLRTNYNMTPEEYRSRWGLPESYPMVAPNYAKVRSQLAKKMGLGTRGMPRAARNMRAESRIA